MSEPLLTYEETSLIEEWFKEEVHRQTKAIDKELAATVREVEFGDMLLVSYGPDLLVLNVLKESLEGLMRVGRMGAVALVETNAVIRARLMAHRQGRTT